MLSVEGLAKSFGPTQALVNATFNVKKGEIVGFVGRNGSGKTTTMRCLLGLTEMDAGTVLLNGRSKSHKDNSTIGYMPEERGLYAKSKVSDQLQHFGELHGLSSKDARNNVMKLLERFEISDFRDRILLTLSLGNQQRVQFIAALVHRPSLLVLDEPFNGLDPVAMSQLTEFLHELTADGAAVLFSSHQLDLVSHLCDRIVIIDKGSVIAEDSMENLQRREMIKYRATGSLIPQDLQAEFPGIVQYESANSVLATFDGINFPIEKDRLLKVILQRGSLDSFTEIQPTLSEIYRELIENG
jgi:ABC-2 type transport system ATP-binding protein